MLDQERFRRDHRWAPGRMSDYLDGALAQHQQRRMEHHLGECQACRRLLAGLRQTVVALRRLAAPGSPVETSAIAASVRARLRAQR